MTTTSNMGLVLPDPSVTLGPAWATLLNAALAQIDTHDHSSGKGVKVTPAGFNFTANLPCAGFELQDAGALVLRSLTVDKTSAGSVYCKNGELYWVSSGGVAVQITSGTGLNLASTGTIGGDYGGVGVTASATYSDSLKTFSWLQDAGIAAKMFCGDILLTFPGASENSVTLKAQTGSAAYSYSWPLAAPVANDSIMCATTAGVNSFKVIAGTTNQVTVTASSSALTLSLPQSIHTGASPTFTGLTLSGLTASYAVVTNGSKALASLQYTSAGTASTLVQRDGSGNATFNTLNLSGLTASRAVVTDGSKNLTSLAYDTAATASTLVQRDGSGNSTFVGLTVSGLTASQVVVTNGSKALASLAYATAATANAIAQRDSSGNLTANYIVTGSTVAQKVVSAVWSGSTSQLTIAHGLTAAKIVSLTGIYPDPGAGPTYPYLSLPGRRTSTYFILGHDASNVLLDCRSQSTDALTSHSSFPTTVQILITYIP